MDRSGFRNVIQNILNRWSGLRLSVEHQSGGRKSKDKALYLIDYVHEVLLSYSKVEQEDLEDMIADYMDKELQTILEDDSVREIAQTILHLYDVYQSSGNSGVAQEINRLPYCDTWLDITYPVSDKPSADDSSDEESESEAEAASSREEPMDCEWTEVKSRRKR